jgi:2-oxoglutarate ferredoxin oxidoreductase subunit beta
VVNSSNGVRRTKKALQKAFEYQRLKKGTCLIEIIGNCPSNWKMTPAESNVFIDEHMLKTFPPGDIKLPKL